MWCILRMEQTILLQDLFYPKRHGPKCTMNFMLSLQRIQEKYFCFILQIPSNLKNYRYIYFRLTQTIPRYLNIAFRISQTNIQTEIYLTLQKAFRNFLEMACHCVVLDLFDEALFQTICYDPEKWLANLLKVSSITFSGLYIVKLKSQIIILNTHLK